MPKTPGSATNHMAGQAMRIPRHTVVFVTHADVQGEILPDLPVIFEESAPFILMQFAKFSARIPRRARLLGTCNELQILRIIEEECLLDGRHIASEIRQ